VPGCIFIDAKDVCQSSGTNLFLRMAQEHEGKKPLLQVNFRLMKNSVDSNAVGSVAIVAVVAMLERHLAMPFRLAIGTNGLVIPAKQLKMLIAIIPCWKTLVNRA
jgi:hypothetical protein